MKGEKNLMKKIIVISAIVILVSLALVACGNGGSSGGGDGPSGDITFFYWGDEQRSAMDNVIGVMKEFAPDVNVETTVIPWGQYWTTVQIALASAAEPDVFWVNKNNAVSFFAAGFAQEIETYIERDNIDVSVFPQALQDLYTHEGKLHAIPKDFDTIALYYNKALFDAKDVSYPTDSWTWDDLLNAALQLTEGNVFGFGSTAWGQGMVFPWILSNGGSILSADGTSFDLDNPGAIEAVQWLIDAMYVHGISPDGASQLEMDCFERFQAGQIAMLTGGSWSVSVYKEMLGDNLGVARLPISQQPSNIIHGLGITMSARSENKEAAWALQKAFTIRESGEAQAVAVIPAYTGAESIWVNNFPELNLQVFIDAAQYATPVPVPTVSSPAQQAAFDDVLQSIWIQEEDVATAFRRLSGEVATIVAEAE